MEDHSNCSQGNKILQQKVVGGVTLNHLAWAAQVGGNLNVTDCSCKVALIRVCSSYALKILYFTVNTGLLAIHGNDEAGTFIRSHLRQLGVSLKYITSKLMYTSIS